MKAGRELAPAEVLTLLITLLFFLGVILMSRMFRDVVKGHVALRKNAEALQAASLYARTLLETSLDPLVTINAEGKITDVNASTERITGLNRERLIGSDFADYFTEPELARAGYREAFASGQIRDYPLTLRHLSGAVAKVLYNASVYRNAQGEVLGVFAAARDITERIRVEEALRENEVRLAEYNQLLAGILEHTNMMAVLLDPRFNFVWVNRAYANTCRHEPSFFPGKNHFDLYPHAENQALFQDVVDTGEPLFIAAKPFEFPDQPERGVTYWDWSLIPVKKEDGEIRSLVFTLADVTDRARAEESLRLASLYSRTLLETSLDPLVTISAEGKITDVNAATERMTGLNRERLIGSDFADYCTEPELARTGYRKAFVDGQVSDYPLTVRHASGSLTEVLYNASVYRNEQGEVIGVFAAARDITERKKAEGLRLDLERKVRQMEKSDSLGRMAGAVAHLFNNLLGGVLGNLEIAMEELPSGSPVMENLSEAMQAGRRAAEVSGLMLAYLGQAPGKHEALDLSEQCRNSLPIVQSILPKGTDLDTDLCPAGPTVMANAHQVQQVINSLCANASEALGDGGGVIRMTVRTVSKEEIPSAHRFPLDWQPQDEQYACLEVRDAGCGIAEQDIEKLFDPFFTSKFTGRGLGLPVVLGILRTHRGVVTVESTLGQGSVFRAFFPVSVQNIPRQTAAASPDSEYRGHGTILLLEDEPVLRKMAKTMLTRFGFVVLEAKDGVEGVELFGQHRAEIRCVISDMTMPRMDGWETLVALRRLNAGIPVILASGYDRAQVMKGEHPEWPQAFLGKPYRSAELQEALRLVLEKGAVEEERPNALERGDVQP